MYWHWTSFQKEAISWLFLIIPNFLTNIKYANDHKINIMVSSVFKKDTILESTPIAANAKILTNNITFSELELSPGRSGAMRVWIAIVTAADADTILTVTYDGSFTEIIQLQADNNFLVKSKGLYRFDVPIRADINWNIKSSVEITSVELFFLDKIVFGA